jgi:hypothetical protein
MYATVLAKATVARANAAHKVLHIGQADQGVTRPSAGMCEQEWRQHVLRQPIPNDDLHEHAHMPGSHEEQPFLLVMRQVISR